MADTEAEPAPAAAPAAVEDDHPTALIGRGESVLVKEVPPDSENPKDVAAEIEALKESEVRIYVFFVFFHVIVHLLLID